MSMNVSMGSMFQNQMFAGGMMKSTQQKIERKQECDGKVAFYENRISALKDKKCDSIEDISRKLELFHSYQDEIAAARKEYNNGQMMHVMDEAIERAEKIAEAAEKRKVKSAGERKEELREEALGIEEADKGLLAECMEEVAELTEDLTEELSEDMAEELYEECNSSAHAIRNLALRASKLASRADCS